MSSRSSGGGVGAGSSSSSPAAGGEAEESCVLPPPGHNGAGPGVRAMPALPRPTRSPAPRRLWLWVAAAAAAAAWKGQRACPQPPAPAPSPPAATRPSARGCLDSAVADATAEAEAGAARLPPPAAAATPLPAVPARRELLGTRNAPPRPAGGGAAADPHRRDEPALLPRRPAARTPSRPPPRPLPPPCPHAPPLSKKRKKKLHPLGKPGFSRGRAIWTRVGGPAPRPRLVSPLRSAGDGLSHSAPLGAVAAGAHRGSPGRRAAGLPVLAPSSPEWCGSPAGPGTTGGGAGKAGFRYPLSGDRSGRCLFGKLDACRPLDQPAFSLFAPARD